MASKGFVNVAPGKWGRGQRSKAGMMEGRCMQAETINREWFSNILLYGHYSVQDYEEELKTDSSLTAN